MSAHELTRGDARGKPGVAGWKVAGGIASAIAMAPVIGLVFFFFVATVLPGIPLFAALLAGFTRRGPRRAREEATDVEAPSLWHTAMARHP